MKTIPYGRQCVSQADIDAVEAVLRSDWLTQGPAIEEFERSVAAYCGVKYAVAVSSATAGLHLACLAAGLAPGDALWTSPNTFVASANCALYCGAEVGFVDIDAQTYNLDPNAFEVALAAASKRSKLPKVVVPVHFAGASCDMAPIAALAAQFGVTVIEDASHAVGASYQGRRVGSCTYSDLTVFSFHAVKVITSGEGGMVTTNRRDLYERLVALRSHGITRDATLMDGESHGAWYYQQLSLGFNYRMTDIQAALGRKQFEKIDEFVDRRAQIARRYDVELSALELVLPARTVGVESSHHLYVVQLPRTSRVGRRDVFERMRAEGIGVNVHYIPVHTQPYYRRMGFRLGDFPVAEAYYEQALTLPLYVGLSDDDQAQVIRALKSALGH